MANEQNLRPIELSHEEAVRNGKKSVEAFDYDPIMKSPTKGA